MGLLRMGVVGSWAVNHGVGSDDDGDGHGVHGYNYARDHYQCGGRSGYLGVGQAVRYAAGEG